MNFFKFQCFWVLTSILLLLSCQENYKTPEAIEKVKVDLSVKRFEQQFANLDKQRLEKLRGEFGYLFPDKYPDTFWLKKSNDSIQLALRSEVKSEFPNTESIEQELVLFYKHLLFYYPQIKVPEIITFTNDVDYKNSVVQGNGKLLVALDCYLGSDHEFYQNISNYISNNLSREHIVTDVAEIYAQKIIGRSNSRDFISQMIHKGKQKYLAISLVPFKSADTVFKYEISQWEWAEVNEKFIWEYFIDKQLLFKTDKNLASRFLDEAPFTKFYMDFDAETPGRLGQYIGYKIVDSFMKHNKVSLQQLVELDSKYIFEHSKYKPKK